MTSGDRERLEQLDKTVGHLLTLIDMMTSQISTLTARTLALTRLAEERGILPAGAVLVAMPEMELTAESEIELGPEYEENRRVRQEIQGRAEPEE